MAVRLLLVFIAGLILGALLGLLLLPLPWAEAQGIGLYGTTATGTRTNCSQITDAVAGQTFCFEQSENVLKGWNGSAWRPLTVPVSATPTCTNNCGTGATITGTNGAMRITIGATGTPRSPFLVLFGGSALAAAPSCITQLDTATTTTVSVTNASTTGALVNTVVGPSQGGVFSMHCIPVQ